MTTVQLTFRFPTLSSTFCCVARSYAEHVAKVAEMEAAGWFLVAAYTVR